MKLRGLYSEYIPALPSYLSRMNSLSMNHSPVNNIIDNQIVSKNLIINDRRIPIVIIIFDDGRNISYRAYSPTVWQTDINENDDGFVDQYGQFLARVYQRVTYNPLEPMNTATPLGVMKEVHSRALMSPLVFREGGNCYFTTYIHPHTPYKPVHRVSPVFFSERLDANDYAAAAPGVLELFHRVCPHEFV